MGTQKFSLHIKVILKVFLVSSYNSFTFLISFHHSHVTIKTAKHNFEIHSFQQCSRVPGKELPEL